MARRAQHGYLVVLLHGLLPHLIGLVASVADRPGLVSPPQGVGGELACGQVSRAALLHLRRHTALATAATRAFLGQRGLADLHPLFLLSHSSLKTFLKEKKYINTDMKVPTERQECATVAGMKEQYLRLA